MQEKQSKLMHKLPSWCTNQALLISQADTTTCCMALSDLFFLIRLTRELDGCLLPASISASVVPDHDDKRIRKYSSKWQNGLRHADEAVLAQIAPTLRVVPHSILRQAILRVAAVVDSTSTTMAHKPAGYAIVHMTHLADASDA